MNLERMQKLVSLIEKHGLVGMAFNPGPTLTYLTGLNFHLMERPTLLLITQTGSVAMVLPRLEKGKLSGEIEVFRVFTYGDDPNTWPAAFKQASKWLNLHQGRVGVAPNRLRFLELNFSRQGWRCSQPITLLGIEFLKSRIARYRICGWRTGH